MDRVCLVVVHNHQYLDNIEAIDRLYRARFPDVVQLVPFYEGDRPDVIAVYESSHFFQGYVAQAASPLLARGHDLYLFIADDLVLHPSVSAATVHDTLALGVPGACFLPGFIDFSHRERYWPRAEEALQWRIDRPGLEAAGQLPDATEAAERLARFGLDGSTIDPRALRRPWPIADHDLGLVHRTARVLRRGARQVLHDRRSRRRLRSQGGPTYPLVGGYSDIFAISRDVLPRFAHYCGVFAASDLFVEVAIPTALALAADHISTSADCALRGRALWDDEVRILDRYDRSLDRLLADFPEGWLFVHPVKLSHWHCAATP